jgi:uncharacterized protein (DUF433 family)
MSRPPHRVPGIAKCAGVCGGAACITGTRIPVWVLVQARRLGTTEAELLRWYPTLHAEGLAAAWAYARAYRREMNREIRENETA